MTWHRTSRQSRGYDEDWLRVRLLALQRDNYLCRCPRCKGGELRITVAQEVDHIVPLAQGGARLELDNLRSVNRECHKRITAEQRGYTIKPRYNRYGYRIENKDAT
jgi:5-methylcytosine-specific restriction protein A